VTAVFFKLNQSKRRCGHIYKVIDNNNNKIHGFTVIIGSPPVEIKLGNKQLAKRFNCTPESFHLV